MIEITELLKKNSLPKNYFAHDAYVIGDFELGLIENRQGARLIALPEVLIRAIYSSLEQETGQAAGLVLYNCGRWWGKSFYRRFNEELSDYYNRPLAEMEMIELVQSLKQCWKTHGWGMIDLDFNYYQKGFLVVKIENSPFVQSGLEIKTPICFAEAGILAAFFSELTGEELESVQTQCESLGLESNYFILGLSERINPIKTWVEEGQNHDKIIENIIGTSS